MTGMIKNIAIIGLVGACGALGVALKLSKDQNDDLKSSIAKLDERLLKSEEDLKAALQEVKNVKANAEKTKEEYDILYQKLEREIEDAYRTKEDIEDEIDSLNENDETPKDTPKEEPKEYRVMG